jgi:regulatory protein
MEQKKVCLTPKQALQQIQKFCAYQERSHYETQNKLFSYGLNKAEVEQIITALIEENFLNEERFATLLAGGKFRIKQWGKVKIKYELLQHRVSPYNIKNALSQINEQDYNNTLHKLAQKYWSTLKGKSIEKHYKSKVYLQQKGYEIGLINEVIKEFKNQ